MARRTHGTVVDMTERKPPGVPFETWVERQIRLAQERGELDDLPGMGKPLPPSLENELGWIARKLKRENIDTAALLPPALALAREVEDLPRRLLRERREDDVRAIVSELNDRIRRAHVGPQLGPPVRVRPVDVDEAVATWREARSSR